MTDDELGSAKMSEREASADVFWEGGERRVPRERDVERRFEWSDGVEDYID